MIQSIEASQFSSQGISAEVLRLDRIDKVVTGNKWYKLKHYLQEARVQGKNSLVSFGGAYSNHLVAMARACHREGLVSTGIIRGEEQKWNPSLEDMKNEGMNLRFISREEYRDKNNFITSYIANHPDAYYVPEGGAGPLGIRGASEIMQEVKDRYDFIACAVGTGTTFTGLINGSRPGQTILGVHCVKLPHGNNTVSEYVRMNARTNNYRFIDGYDFGGFGKKSDALIRFMNHVYDSARIPTDFVYTGKLFYAIFELTQKRYFPENSRILLIHSGGLQGNRSLPEGLLHF